jgi:hypothetical protein
VIGDAFRSESVSEVRHNSRPFVERHPIERYRISEIICAGESHGGIETVITFGPGRGQLDIVCTAGGSANRSYFPVAPGYCRAARTAFFKSLVCSG